MTTDWSGGDAGDSLEIAIIGMSGRFPAAKTLEEYWRNLRDGVESIRLFTDEELLALGVDSSALRSSNFIKAGSILDDVDKFDASFFGYSPREAEMLDPQHRIFLECAWEALENAGHTPDAFEGLIGVYAGMSLSTYLLYNLLDNPRCSSVEDHFQVMLGSDKDFLSTRVSYHFNLKGPSIDVQTGCSTSLVAVHLACQSLLGYQCDLALAGGVSIQVPQRTGYYFQEGGVNSPDGHCRAFDARAQGTIFGSGAGLVVLRRLADAINDGDYILAVIKGSAINNDGAVKIGYTAPGLEGQARVIAAAQAMAGVEAETISYVETHGTGTALGDPVEVAALTKAFRASAGKNNFCAIGSVKTNLGHLDAAAGVAGLIKTVLALKHKQLPPSLHFESPNPKIDFDNSPFYVNSSLSEWNGSPRRAGVSSFGIGGTNAHVILEESPASRHSSESRPYQLLLLSSKTSAALETATAQLAQRLKQHPDLNPADVAYTLQVGRKDFDYKRMVVCRDLDDAVSAIETDPQRVFTAYQETREKPVIFMFPGGGAQYVNMGYGLYESEPAFREPVDNCCEILRPMLGYDLREFLYSGDDRVAELAVRMKRTSIGLPALFTVEYAMANLWMSWGIRPQAMIGHSLGEYVAACVAGVFSLEDALSLVVLRGKLLERLPRGCMLSVPLPETQVREIMNGKLSLAAINGPSQCVLSGPAEAIEEMEVLLRVGEIESRKIQIDAAGHSEMVTGILEPLERFVEGLHLNEPHIPYISNVTGTWVKPGQATDPGYWPHHLRHTVRFGDGIRELLQEPDQALLEVGPGQTLSALARLQMDAQRGHVALSSMRHPHERQPDTAFLLTNLGKLWMAGVSIDWSAFYARERRRRVPLPTYPFERKRYWIEPQKGARARQPADGKKPDIADWFYIPSWKLSMLLKPFEAGDLGDDPGSWLVFLDEGGFGSAVLKKLRAEGQDVIQLARGERFSQSRDDLYTINPRMRQDYDALLIDLQARGKTIKRIVHTWSLTQDDQFSSGPEFFNRMQERGFHSLLFLSQALTKESLADAVQICVMSNNLQQVDSKDLCSPEKATLLAPCKVVPQENPSVTYRCVNIVTPLAGSPLEAWLASQLLAEMISPSSDAVIAYRGRQRWVQTFEPSRIEPDTPAVSLLRRNGVYLITGALGGVGLLLAEYLARQAQARLVLTGRSDFLPKDQWERWLTTHDADEISSKIKRLRAIEDLGSEVLVLKADAADLDQMRSVVSAAHQQFGAINGVIHAAGIAGEKTVKLVSETTIEQCEDQFQAKVHGLYSLEKVLTDEPLDFCVLFSSNVSALGGIGSVSYTAANLFMDAFAQARSRSDDRRWISANWDGWLLGEENRLSSSYRTSLDQYAMAPRESTEALRRVIASVTVAQVVVSTGDLARRIEQWITGQNQTTNDSSDGKAAGGFYLRPALGVAYAPPSNELEETIVRVWQSQLGIERPGIHDNFFDLGGNSLIALKVISQLKKELQVEIPVVSLFEGPTVRALAQVISQLDQSPSHYNESRDRGERRRQGRRRHNKGLEPAGCDK